MGSMCTSLAQNGRWHCLQAWDSADEPLPMHPRQYNWLHGIATGSVSMEWLRGRSYEQTKRKTNKSKSSENTETLSKIELSLAHSPDAALEEGFEALQGGARLREGHNSEICAKCLEQKRGFA